MSSWHTPTWVPDAVFYQIFPDRFARSATLLKPANLEPWDSPPTPNGYKGGDLLGVLEKLDYVQALGCNALYFCPIFQSASNHRYHTHDYYQVDPLLGGNTALTRLLAEAHRRGLRVVLDGVFNHASRGCFYFNDILENGRSSPYLDWFYVHEFPPNAYDRTRPPGYTAWWGLHALPKWNVANPQVRAYLLGVAEHWLKQGIDGWRLDVPEEIKTRGFWEEFRKRVKAINPEAYVVGEIWGEAQKFLRGDRFDGVMNYLFNEAALAFAAGPRVVRRLAEGRGSYHPQNPLDGVAYADRIDWLLGLYPWEIQLAQMNLLGSHDTARLYSLVGGDPASVRLALLLLMTFPGAVSIYYGDELGLESDEHDWNARGAFPWDQPRLWRRDLLQAHTNLIALRHRYAALRRGSYHRVAATAATYAFVRRLADEALLVAVNVAEDAQTVKLPVAAGLGSVRELTGVYPPGQAETVKVRQGRVTLKLPPRSGMVLVAGPARGPLARTGLPRVTGR